MANNEETVVSRVVENARLPDAEDGVQFRTETVTARTIRDEALYAGVRVTMDALIATATVKFRIDVNFGDPITPAPQEIDLPTLRPNEAPIRILGYPIETILAEKLATAMTYLRRADTRIRDYADIYTLTRKHDISHLTMRNALVATGQFRGTTLKPLSTVVDNLVELRQQTYTAYRISLGADGEHLPEALADVVSAVTAFADHLLESRPNGTAWRADNRAWLTPKA